jgi:hypothetical protein
MIRFKKSMFGLGANSCVSPTKGTADKCEGCPVKGLVGIVVVVKVGPRPIGRG